VQAKLTIRLHICQWTQKNVLNYKCLILRYIPSVSDILEFCWTVGRAMAEAVSRRPLTAEDRVRAQVNPCGIYGGQSGTGTGFSPSFSVFPCQYHSTVSLQTHINWGMKNMSVTGNSSKTFHPIEIDQSVCWTVNSLFATS
jgi:hypothetical protein